MGQKFEHQIIVGFVYVFEKKIWRLSQLIGERAAMDLGIHYVLRESPEGQYPQHIHLTSLVMALARHPEKLDGGSINYSFDENVYRVEITVRPRKEKPQSQEQAWKEPS